MHRSGTHANISLRFAIGVPNDDGRWRLTNTLSEGTVETFVNLIFHEGPGLALEMRLFTKGGIEDNLRAAFSANRIQMQDIPEFGIIFGYPWSRPITARKRGIPEPRKQS